MEEKQKFFDKKNIFIIFFILFIGLLFSVAISIFIPGNFLLNKKERIYVVYGSGLKKISRDLYENKLIRNRKIFELYVILTGNHKKLKAGEYEFDSRASIFSITNKMIKGDVISHKIVIPEGSDVYDVADILEQNKIVSRECFINLATDKTFLNSIGIKYKNAEGFLFPDTYNFIKGINEGTIIKIMHERFVEKSGITPEKTYNVSGLNLTGYKVLIMASIIEKESKLDSERAKIASVFYNRLKSSEPYMRRLESCATVRYALHKKTGVLTYQDLKVESDYNTYVIIGLPPTPICNPGVKSIQAALYPENTNYRYFVLRENGEHTFSETMEEHNAAKYKNKIIRRTKK
ncbi:MAG: endolytic transglycosylase MltG [Candidatus Goldbacteria bacterium]|nr:endolytic transglycosylase MltG [Candidatus Goldiibacteriota bacterium]